MLMMMTDRAVENNVNAGDHHHLSSIGSSSDSSCNSSCLKGGSGGNSSSSLLLLLTYYSCYKVMVDWAFKTNFLPPSRSLPRTGG